jgi:hypothetical protein
MLKLLRKEQCDDKVTEEENREEQRNDGNEIHVHEVLPELLAGLDVKERQSEENDRKGQHC